jgi:hypothetical protein
MTATLSFRPTANFNANQSRATSSEADDIRRKFQGFSESLQQAESMFAVPIRELGDTFLDCRRENWDGYDAHAVSDEAYRQAKALLWQVLGVFPFPSASANPSGSLTLEWLATPSRRLMVSLNGEQLLAFAGLFGSETVQGTTSFVGDFPLELFSLLKRVYYL